MSARRRPLVVLSGGGTGGHLLPGLALADALAARGVATLLATPGDPGEDAWLPPGGGPRTRLRAPRRPRGAAEVPAFLVRLAASVGRALALLRRHRPEAVLGLGGWPCVPAGLAAALSRTPLFLLASDARPGVAVRRLAPLARAVYAARASATEGLPPRTRVLVTGPVLRASVGRAERDPGRFGLRADRLTLLVVGGSLGSRALNEALRDGLTRAVAATPDLVERIQVLHSTGERGEGVADAYRAAGLTHAVVPFIRDMAAAYAAADLVVCRAGALTCAEIEAVGVPAVLVPYPHHADRQQFLNARPLQERGGAVVLEEGDLTPSAVERAVLGLLLDPGRRARMARALGAAASGGAGQIADDLVRFVGRRRRAPRQRR